MSLKKRYKVKNKTNILLTFIFLFIMFLSIGYSSLNRELNISGESVFRVEEDIRITDIKLSERTFNGLENYNSEHSKDRIKTGITLSEESSTITYLVTITNTGNVPMLLNFLENINYNNDDIIYELSEKLPFIINKGEEKEIKVTYKWNSYNESKKMLDSIIKFNFIKAESVLAQGSKTSFVNNSSLDKSKVESIKFMPTIDVPDSAIEVWDASLNKDGTAVAYTLDNDSNDLYELYIGGYGEIKLSEANYLFYEFTNMLTLDFDNFVNTKNVTNMLSMFNGCSSLEGILDISHFNVSNVTTMQNMFYNCKMLEGLKLNNWTAEKLTNISNMFVGCAKVTELEMNNFSATLLTDTSSLFGNDSTEVKRRFTNIKTININNWNIPKVTNMSRMFYAPYQSYTLEVVNMENLNAPSVTDLSFMFSGCRSLITINISGLDTSNVTTMQNMFYQCYSLKKLQAISWNTEKLTNINGMFYSCSSLVEIDLSLVNSSVYEQDMFKSMMEQIGDITFYVKDSDCKALLDAIKPNATISIKSA